MVGVARFELAASWSQTKRSTKLSYTPIYGGISESRTRDLLLARQALSQLSYNPIVLPEGLVVTPNLPQLQNLTAMIRTSCGDHLMASAASVHMVRHRRLELRPP